MAWTLGALVLVLTAGVLAQSTVGARPKQVRRVLIFNLLEPLSSPGISLMDDGIVAALKKAPFQIELYTENLEATLFPDEATQHKVRELYIRKYRDRKPDVVVAIGPGPLKFMIESHERSFPGIPIVFCGSTEEMLHQLTLDSHFTGVWGAAQPEKTLNAALQMRPSTKHVVVTGGVGEYDRELVSLVRQSLRNYESKLDFIYLTDLDMPTLLERLKRLPSETIVYHTSMMQDAAGSHFIDATESVPLIAGAASAPVFVVDDVDVGNGTIGGDVLSFAEEGRVAGEMVVKVLNGEKPSDMPIVKSANVYTFDWPALRRWGLKESDLPPGSVVLHRQPSVWESYKNYFVGGIFLILVETLLIFGLLRQRARRRKTEAAIARLSGRLIEAQEEERRRIAREIHDDYNQRLAVLAIDLEHLAENAESSPAAARQRLLELWSLVSELGTDLHALSRRLHSFSLESLGLVAGVRAFCDEFAAQQGIQADFAHDGILPGIPRDVALCLFRIVQESLRNIKKHSGAPRAEVRLEVSGEKLHLSVSDRGKGFDSKEARIGGGIGIRSMEERLRLLGGRLEIRSQPNEGTRIDAWLPFKERSQLAS